MAKKKPTRDAELSTRPDVADQLVDVFQTVSDGFAAQRERSDRILDNWDLYDCKLTDKQAYNGTSQVFLPFVRDAVDARTTRFVNQMFPVAGRYVEVTTTDGELPQATMSLLESYVRKSQLQTKIMPALLTNGDVEGQYSLYVSGMTETRNTIRRVDVPDQATLDPDGSLGTHKEFQTDSEKVWRPDVEVLHDNDLLILPVTADSVDDAIDQGGSVTILRRWSKGRVKRAMREGEITKEGGAKLLADMSVAAGRQPNAKDTLADAAGVKNKGKEALVYETWTRLEVGKDEMLCVALYGGDENVLSCKQNPYWCDRVPVLSVPVKKLSGQVKGKAPVEAVADVQILANDCINEGADTAHFSAMPIVMTDPEKNPRTSSMVLGLAAIWETNPNDTQFAQFPELWSGAMGRAQACQAQIFQSLGVNPSMVPSGGSGDGKMSQAEIANQQQVDLLTTADAVTVLEQGILTPLMQRFAEYDHQFREDAVTIRVYGEMGVRAQMERVEPIQLNNRWEFRWFGVEAAQNAAQLQQQIAGMNVIKGIPPQMYKGYELDVSPMITQMVEGLFGPRIGPLIFKKVDMVSLDPLIENDMLQHGFEVPVNAVDDDQLHLAAHMGMMEHPLAPNAHQSTAAHIMAHQQQIAQKAAQQQGAAPPPTPGLPGSPGGAGPGVAGTPRPGGQVEGPSGAAQGPAGMIHPDQMAAAGAVTMPRNT